MVSMYSSCWKAPCWIYRKVCMFFSFSDMLELWELSGKLKMDRKDHFPIESFMHNTHTYTHTMLQHMLFLSSWKMFTRPLFSNKGAPRRDWAHYININSQLLSIYYAPGSMLNLYMLSLDRYDQYLFSFYSWKHWTTEQRSNFHRVRQPVPCIAHSLCPHSMWL